MKKFSFLTLLFLLVTSFSFGQIAHDLEIFSESGHKFKIYVNGLELSDQYGSHVRLDNVQNDNLNIKIEFEDKTIPAITKKYLLLSDPGEAQQSGPASPCSTVYKIKQTKKGKVKLAFVSRSKKKIQAVVNQTTIITNGNSNNTGGNVTIQTPVGGISLTIFK